MRIKSYRATIISCFGAYFVQAALCSLAPLLLLIFSSEFGLDMAQLTLLVTANFVLQLTADIIAVFFADRIGYRATMITALYLCATGIAGMAILPYVMPPLYGLLLSVLFYSIGGGLLEVVVSPTVEACPTDNKQKAMSLLHSFYCWGVVFVVLISTLFLHFAGQENWRTLVLLWAILPIAVSFAFMVVPMHTLSQQGGVPLKQLLKNNAPLLLLLVLLMICSGASEQSVCQWASAFAEQALGVSKTVGDIAGPLMFAAAMGITRALFGKYGDRIDIGKALGISTALCIVSYLLIGLTQSAVAGFIGCAMCGVAVAIMWPGVLSVSSTVLKGGTGMFALLALSGDIGCALGPGLCGLVADGSNLHTGLLCGIIFPLILLAGTVILQRRINKTRIKER